MDKGWIKIYRQIQDCCIWQRSEPFDSRSAWIDLLLTATHSERKLIINNEVVRIRRGSFVTSIVKLSHKWQWSRTKTTRFINLLESEQMINTKRTPKGTLITIVKYDVFQGNEIDSDTTVDTAPDTAPDTTVDTASDTTPNTAGYTTVDTAVDTQNKNVKNVEECKRMKKNVKNERTTKGEPYYPDDAYLDKAFCEYLAMRKRIKKPICTDESLNRVMNKLDKLSEGDNNKAVKILNQSVDNCWQGLFELKEDSKEKKEKNVFDEWLEA